MTAFITANITDRLTGTAATKQVDVFDMNDFPAPSGDIITLVTNTFYVVKAPLTTGNRFVIPAGGTVDIAGVNEQNNTLTYTGTGVLFTSTAAIFRFATNFMQLRATMSGATVISLIGGTGTTSQVVMIRTGCVGFENPGTFQDFAFSDFNFTQFSGIKTGLIGTDIGVYGAIACLFAGDGSTSNSFIKIFPSAISFTAV